MTEEDTSALASLLAEHIRSELEALSGSELAGDLSVILLAAIRSFLRRLNLGGQP